MGLIRAVVQATGSTLADQWKEFFYCDSMDQDVLVQKGRKRTSGNNRGSDNIITNGSGIAVADGQCMMIVEQGRIVEFCAEPGQFTYDTSSEPSIFCGSLGEGIKNTFRTIGARITRGGDTGKDQRVYYFNTKELMDNKFGTPSPIPFRVVDANIGLDIDVSVRCSGVYSYRMTDPLLFYTNVCGNVADEYTRDELETQLKSEFISALQPAFASLSAAGIRPSELPAHAMELADAMNAALTKKWNELRGLSVVSVALNPITLPEEDAKMIRDLQRTAVYRNANMAAAAMVDAQADAMKTAAGNSAGAMTGFMGMNMAGQMGGMNAQNLFQMGQGQPAAQPVQRQQQTADSWTCSCGAVNTGKFCGNCGAPRPTAPKKIRCDKCGWEPTPGMPTPKFCPECGDPINDADIVG